jgi:uncharacterized protein
MHVKFVFVDLHSDLRSGWRMILFLVLTAAFTFVLVAPVRFLRGVPDFAIRVLLTMGVVAGSYVITRFVNRKPFSAIGLSLHPDTVREFGLGCLLGILMTTGIFVVEYFSGFIGLTWRGLSFWNCVWVISSSCGYFLIGASFEEILFRGYFFQTLLQAVTVLPAMVLMALLFAFSHLGNPHATTFGLINVGLAAIWLSVAYLKTRSLWLPIGLHATWNFFQTTIFSFPTSGVEFLDRKLFLLTQSGPEWITGGAFGPEGGALATIALICSTWYILKSRMVRIPEGIVTLDSVEDLLQPPEKLAEEPTT